MLLCKYIPGLYEGRGQTLHYFSLLFYYSKPDNKKYLSHICLQLPSNWHRDLTWTKADSRANHKPEWVSWTNRSTAVGLITGLGTTNEGRCPEYYGN